MKHFLYILVGVSLICGQVFGQDFQWTNLSNIWAYNLSSGGATSSFKGGDGTTVTGSNYSYSYSITGNSNSGWLPMPPTGSTKLLAGGTTSVSGEFKIVSNELEIPISPKDITPNKFSGYNISDATSIAKMSFYIDFKKIPISTGVGGNFSLIIGKPHTTVTNTIFGNHTNLGGVNPSIFTAFQWGFTGNGKIQLRLRTSNSSGGINYPFIESEDYFNESGGPYFVEIYMNNSAASQTYLHDGEEETLPVGKLHFWVNTCKRLNIGGDYNLPASISDGFAAETEINSFAFIGQKTNNGSTTYDNEKIGIQSLKISYADVMNTLPLTADYSFSVEKNRNEIMLKWQAMPNSRDVSFEILKSSPMNSFNKIANIKAYKGIKNYSHIDKDLPAEPVYYQLKKIDVNGNEELLSTKLFRPASVNNFCAYIDNSDNLKVMLNSNLLNHEGDFAVIDLLGRRVFEAKIVVDKGNNEFVFPANKLKRGVYSVLIQVDGDVFLTKLLK